MLPMPRKVLHTANHGYGMGYPQSRRATSIYAWSGVQDSLLYRFVQGVNNAAAWHPGGLYGEPKFGLVPFGPVCRRLPPAGHTRNRAP
jgi:hypothetical protein